MVCNWLRVRTCSLKYPVNAYQFSYPLPASKSYYKFIFEGNEGATSEEASFSGLINSWNKSLSQKTLSSDSTYVVQSVLLCNRVQMASSLRGKDHTLAQRLKSREACPLMPMALILPTIRTAALKCCSACFAARGRWTTKDLRIGKNGMPFRLWRQNPRLR